MEQLTEQEQQFHQWKQHPVTELFLQKVQSLREGLKEDWANAAFAASFEAESIARNAAGHGACSAYQELLDLTHEDLFGDSDE